MDILLPKSSTGGNEDNWQTVEHSFTTTQKEQIKSYAEYISLLGTKTREIEGKVAEIYLLKDDILKSKKDAQEALDKIKDTHALVIFGFFALLLVVIGICYGYWQFVFDSSRNEDYRYGVMQKINDQNKDLENLKKCLKGGGWNICF